MNLPVDAQKGAGGACAKHGVYDGTTCPYCAAESMQPDVNKLIPGPEPLRYMGHLPMPSAAISVERCVKCGAGEPKIRYHEDAGREHGCGWYGRVQDNEPHLHFTCRTCHHEWTRRPLDARRAAHSEKEAD